MDALFYKLVDRETWDRVREGVSWEGSPDDLRDGFVHLSLRGQLDGTLRKHFSGQRDLLVLGVELSGSALRWEVSRGGALFPHLYGPLPIAAVRLAMPVPLGKDGHELPELPPSPYCAVCHAGNRPKCSARRSSAATWKIPSES